MANKTIAQLTAASAAAPSNLIEMDDGSGASWKLTLDQVRQGIVQNSGNITLDNSSLVYSKAHGLGRTPSYVRTVLVCLSNDAGWGCVAGDEIEVQTTQINARIGKYFGANATLVLVSLADAFVGNEAQYVLVPKPGGAGVAPTSFNNFALKFYFF